MSRHPGSTFDSSSYVSSSAYSESYDDDEDDQDMQEQDDEQEEEVCESYCSSEEEDTQDSLTSPSSDTYSLRMKRILAWRENFSAHLSATLSGELCNFFVL
jgi:hypothetical protein